MSLSESGTTNITPTSGQTAAQTASTKLADYKAISIYRRPDSGGDTACYARIGDVSGGTLDVGSEQEIDSLLDAFPDVDRLSDTLALMEYCDGDDTNKGKLRTLSVSGSTITENSPTTYESSGLLSGQHRVAVISASVGLVAYRTSSGPTHKLCRFTVASGTATPGTPANHSESGIPKGMAKLDSSHVFYVFSGSAIKCQIIDISSTISEGATYGIPGVTDADTAGTAIKSVAVLSSTKVAVAFTQTGSKISAVIASISGGVISYGSVYDIATGSSAAQPVLYPISSDQFLVMYKNGSNATVVETLNVTGTTISSNGDSVSLTQSQGTQNNIVVVIDGKAIATWRNSVNNGYMAMISGVPTAIGPYDLIHSQGGIPGAILVTS